ncbi:MAG: ubiquinol-cytochrome c reductase iron-sulfur subunit [Nitrospinales bacterium]
MKKIEDKSATRREFFSYALMGSSLFAGFALLGVYAAKYLIPPPAKKLTRKLFVATIDRIPPGHHLNFKDLKGQEIAITNTGEEFIALSSRCTHLGCRVHWKQDRKIFYCPCHGGVFDARGKVLKGPPPAPLRSYRIEVINQSIYIYVDEVFLA